MACQDINDLAIILAKSVGGDFRFQHKWNIQSARVNLLGDDSDDWTTHNWNLHLFIQKSSDGLMGPVWDATFMLDADSDNMNLPETPILPVRWSFNQYKEMLLQPGTNWSGPGNDDHDPESGNVTQVE